MHEPIERRIASEVSPCAAALLAAAVISGTLTFAVSAILAFVAFPLTFISAFAILSIAQGISVRVAVPRRLERAGAVATVLIAGTLSAVIVYRSAWRQRFRELVVDPVPTSVANVTVDEGSLFSDVSFLRFDISPDDVEAVARRRGMTWLTEIDREPVRYESLVADWPLYHRPANRRAASGSTITLVYDVHRHVAWVAVDHLAASIGHD